MDIVLTENLQSIKHKKFKTKDSLFSYKLKEWTNKLQSNAVS